MAVRVWLADADAVGADAERYLDEAELRRAAEFRSPGDRRRYATSHALQRLLGARHSGVPVDRVSISRACAFCAHGGHGKPRVDAAPELDFSVSHTGSLVGLAATVDGRVGLDVETAGRAVEAARLWPVVASDGERRRLAGLTGERARLATLELWTRKEAVIKLTGHGLAVPLPYLSVDGPVARVRPAPAGWPAEPIHLAGVSPGRGYLGAVATTERQPVVTARRLRRLDDLLG